MIKTFSIGERSIELSIPDSEINGIHSPYWAKVWPAAEGLCVFLESNLELIKEKRVMELAAGLGLPGMYATHYASYVCLSDIEPIALTYIEKSAQLNRLNNVQCKIVDWNEIDAVDVPDILLLSDINYEPAEFDSLFSAIQFFLNRNCTILLSSPQRLVAKSFISRILPFVVQQEEFIVGAESHTAISVFVLKPANDLINQDAVR